MGKYILNRLLRSLVSIFFVIGIVFTLVYTLIPRENIFTRDENYSKYTKPDERLNYRLTKFESYGYLDYVQIADYCYETYPLDSVEYAACGTNPEDYKNFESLYKSRGYNVSLFSVSGIPYAQKEISPIVMLFNWFGNMLEFDHVNKVQDPKNPDLERKIYLGTDWNGVPALLCSGCENKYQVYFDQTFPFIHFNWVKLNLGISFPAFNGKEVLNVITDRQNSDVLRPVKFPSGATFNTAIMEHTCSYKPILDDTDQRKFLDNYADCASYKSDPSMIGTSFIIGVIATIISYLIGLPVGLFMAKSKDRIIDKIGIAYIVFIISVPSLAYIYMFSRIGMVLQLPVKFSAKGAGNPLSYMLPIISLALPAIAGLMMWMRRYMIDQSLTDYVKFARAKGLSETSIFSKHIMRNAIIPIVHGIPGAILFSLTGAIITEGVYAVPGMGKMLTDAINSYNNGMIIALTFFYSALSIISLILGDILMAMVDPRISFTEKGR